MSHPSTRRRWCLPFLFAAASTALFAQHSADGAELTVGRAQTVITPILRSPMAGYYFDREAEGVHDDLMAKAILFRLSGKTVGLVTCDLIELPRAVVDKAKTLVKERTGILPSHLMLSATHAHTGPRHEAAYDDWLVEKIADTVQMAAARLEPAQVAFGVGEEKRLPYHRRFWMKDGTLRTNPGKLNPDIVRPAGGIDPSVPVLEVLRLDGSPLAIVVNYSLHLDTVGGTSISADFPHYLSSILCRVMGQEMLTLHTTGACGNINHWDVHSEDPQRSFAEAERIGTMLAGEVLKVTTFAEPVGVDRIDGLIEEVELPLKSFGEEELAKAREIVKIPNPPDVDFVLERVWALRALEVAGRKQPTIPARVQAIRVGDVALVAVPCELFYELGLDIKRKSPFPHTVVVELANDNIGYVPRQEDYENGGYEVVNSRLAPGGGEQIVETAIGLLNRLRQ
jgi:hypothetical protein